MWMREHQRPWTLGSIVAADTLALKQSLAAKIGGRGYRRGWLVVGGDHGYWREERLCLRRGGAWSIVVDSHRSATVAEPRTPAHPELIPELEQVVRTIVARERISEGTIHMARPGLLFLGYDADTDAMYGLSGYREVLELFWKIRMPLRFARGTGVGP